MQIIDPGHIYLVFDKKLMTTQKLMFVKRSGGAITYPQEWAGTQTQAVMRALIAYITELYHNPEFENTYDLFQLGSDETQPLRITRGVCLELVNVLIDRSRYLNDIIPCLETSDAITWLEATIEEMQNVHSSDRTVAFEAMASNIRSALWCYEARAYRRKQEGLNRKQPEHDDSARLRGWRDNPADDVPFNEIDIELRSIGSDGHIVLV